MSRICHLASAHAPNDDRIFYKEARSLAKAGYDVHIVLPRSPDAPRDPDGVHFDCLGAKRGWISRLVNLWRMYRTVCGLRPALCHCHEPDSLLVGVMLKRRLGCKLVFDSHEWWRGVVAQRMPRGLARPLAWLYDRFERRLLARCDAAIGATGAITSQLAARAPAAAAETLLNVPAEEVFEAPAARPPAEAFVLCHDGSLTFVRGLKVMAEAVRRLARDHQVVLKIVGDVFGAEREWLENYVREHHLEGVIQRTGWLPYEKVGAALAECHLGLVAFVRMPNHVIAAPNKVFNYLLAGIPFVGPDFMVELQRMEAVDGCCLLADCRSPESLAGAVAALLQDRARYERLVRNARAASAEKYRWRIMERRLLDLYHRVLADGPA